MSECVIMVCYLNVFYFPVVVFVHCELTANSFEFSSVLLLVIITEPKSHISRLIESANKIIQQIIGS